MEIKKLDLEENSLAVVDREAMPGINSMKLEGEVRNLGIVKNFRDTPELGGDLPKDLSISWAHLDPEEALDTHRHPVASLIVAIEGNGCSQGDTKLDFSGGDILLIPPWNEHGFTGSQPAGLWALSIQFNDIAIFESEIDPLTTFEDNTPVLPPLEERQIIKINRDNLIAPKMFKNRHQLHKALPENVDFSWHKITLEKNIMMPTTGNKRLFIVCSSGGALVEPFQKKIIPGMAFWQTTDLCFCALPDQALWVLSIEVKNYE